MSDPHFYPRDYSVHGVRKTRDNLIFFAPTKRMVRAVLFIIFVWAERLNIKITSYVIMGNHIHIHCFDADPFANAPSNVPMFFQLSRASISQYLGRYWDIRGCKVDPDSKSGPPTIIADGAAELRTAAYIIANPVEGGIVADPGLFEDAVADPALYLESKTLERPNDWFSSRSWPESVKMRLHVPPLARLEGHSPESWATAVTDRVEKLVRAEVLRRKLQKLGFMGIVRARAETPFSGPKGQRADHSLAIVAAEDSAAAAKVYSLRRAMIRQHRKIRERIEDGEMPKLLPYGSYRLARTLRTPTRPAYFPLSRMKVWFEVHYAHPYPP